MKKLLCLFMALLMLASAVLSVTVSADAELPFTDVKKKAWFYDAVKYSYDNSLMNGTSATLFEPQGKVTRAMFVTMLGRLHGAEESCEVKFKDVNFKKGAWYAGYVGWASDNGIVTGFEDNTFRPNEKLSREQMAAIIMRYITFADIIPTRSPDALSYFADEKRIGSWAKEYVDEMRLIGIITGKDGGKFDPKGDLTRAEAATIVMRLDEMLKLLALGEQTKPDYTVEGENFALMGAWDLYYGGTAIDSGYSGVGVATDEEFPYLREDTNETKFLLGATGDRTHDDNTSFGVAEEFNPLIGDKNFFEVDMGVACISKKDYPVVRFAYRTERDAPLGFGYMIDIFSGYAVDSAEMYDFEEKAETKVDGGWKYGIVDVGTEVPEYWPTQFIATLVSDADIELLYFAAFPDMASAEAFDVTKYKAELSSYEGKVVEVIEASEKDVQAALDEAYGKADSIVNYSGNIDPATIKGSCYYISNNGDDSNSGTSPDAPWKSFKNLYSVKGNAAMTIVNYALQPGDAVLLERGSVFDKYRYGEYDALNIAEGITYGTYGEGPKPVITGRLIMDEPAGRWVQSGYNNVWKLDYKVPDYPGNIEFVKKDGTELWGICVYLDNYETPYNGEPTKNYGFVTNGEDFFHSGNVPFTDPGCLKNNLEYFADVAKGELYVYCDKGNPGDVFGEINITRKEMAIDDTFGSWANSGVTKQYNSAAFEYTSSYKTVVDGLSIKYAGVCGINTWGADDVFVTNCDFEWIGGSFENPTSRYGNAVSNWGDSDGFFVTDCYFKDVYDAAVSTQSTYGRLVNYYSSGCVLDRCGLSYEFFVNDNTSDDGISYLSNIFITDNYVMRPGFGFCDIRADRRGAFFIPGYHMTNATVDENIVYAGNKNFFTGEYAIFGIEIALGKAPGAQLYNNTYYMDPAESYYGKLVYNLHTWSGSTSALYPYNSQYLTYLNSLGVETGSTFYSAPNPDDAGNRK